MGAPTVNAIEHKSAGESFACLDGLRAVFVVLVIMVHGLLEMGVITGWSIRFQVGVHGFFALSAFLLYRPFVAARYSGRPLRLGMYAQRRAARILPGYWVALTLLAIWPGLVAVFTGDWWIYYGFLQVYDTTQGGLGVAWSLCHEVLFYLLLPLYALLIGRLQRAPHDLRPEFAGVLVLAAVTVTARIMFSQTGGILWFTLPHTALSFGMGLGLAAWSVHLRERGGRPAALRVIQEHPWALLALAVAIFVGVAQTNPIPIASSWQHVVEGLGYAAMAGIVVAIGAFGDGLRDLPRRFLTHPWIAFTGLISYAIFLYHGPLVAELAPLVADLGVDGKLGGLVAAVLGLAVTLPVAWISYRVVELPAMRAVRRGRRTPTTPLHASPQPSAAE